jgi:hypothetical protein
MTPRRAVAAASVAIAFLASPGCSGRGADSDRSATQARHDQPATTTPITNDSEPTHATTSTAKPGTAEKAGGAGTVDAASPSAAGRPFTPEPTAAAADTFVAPAGDYEYLAEGWTETHNAAGTDRTDHRDQQIDHISVSDGPRPTMTVRTTRDGANLHEVRYRVDTGVTHLTQLTTWPDQPASPGVTITPSPPIPAAGLPYTVGETWEFAWRDDSVGVQGTGTTTVLPNERVETAAGTIDTVVIEIHQHLTGAITTDLVTTAWIDRSTGIQWRQRIVTDTHRPTGTTHAETNRTLMAAP